MPKPRSNSNADRLLVERIRKGEEDAWSELIGRYEGRLLAFVDSRLNNRATSEDVVQEAFVGFLRSLPNYDGRPLESYLFSICAYKMTDQLRRDGRRPAIPLSSGRGSQGPWELPSPAQSPSSIARGDEKERIEEEAVVAAIKEQVDRWRERGDYTKLKCIELLFVRGRANKDVAVTLEITEQQVANFKYDFLSRMRSIVGQQNLSEEIFPELYEN